MGYGTWKNSELWPIYRLWDFEKFRALPLYRVRGTCKNSELLLYREGLGEATQRSGMRVVICTLGLGKILAMTYT